jgi:hypothetical protein
MHIDTKELASVAAAAAPRFDMYAGIHKALRAFMADTLLAVGRMDSEDDADIARTAGRVLDLLRACASHLAHENEFLHTAIEARAPGASALIAHDHEEHVEHIAKLQDLVGALRGCSGADRFATAARLYRELALFVADNFRHMHVEETAHNAVLWARYTDAELVAIHDALVASIPPAEMMLTARWLVPFMNPAERAALVGDMRAKAPPPAFDAILAVTRPHMTTDEWAKLMRSLGLPVVAGLVAA